MTTRTAAVLVALICTSLAGWMLLARRTMPYTTDSAAYVEAAASARAGEGFLVTTYGIHPVDADRGPLALFPPGYPMVIAAVAALGVGVEPAALAVQALAFAFLPWLFWRLFRRIVAPGTALVMAALCPWTAATATAALQAWSDVPFLALALASLEALFTAVERRSIGATALAGALAGAACLTRNVGYALVAAHLVGLGAAVTWRGDRRNAGRTAAAWLVAFSASYGWWLVRNRLVFGTIQPYAMDASELTLGATVAQAARAAATSVLGTRSGKAAAIGLPLVAAALVGAALVGLRRLRDPAQHPSAGARAVVWTTLASYGIAGLGLVILTRARYRWGEPIGDRHLLQYAWIALVGLAAAFDLAVRDRRWRRLAGGLLIVAFVLAHARPLAHRLRWDVAHARPELETVRAMAPVVADRVPASALLASNVAPLLRITSARPVRQIHAAATPAALRDAVTPTRDLYLALFPCATFCRGLYEGAYPAWLDDFGTALAAAGYEIVDRTPNGVLVRAPRVVAQTTTSSSDASPGTPIRSGNP